MSDQNRSVSPPPFGNQFQGLWRHPDFIRLWIGQTISEFGSWLGALPLMAILLLDATPVQMGMLETMRSAPALILGLFALLIPMAGGSRYLAIAMLLLNQVIGDIFYTLYFIGELSLRQFIIPDNMMGRKNASFNFLVGGMGTIGIFNGGLLASIVGLRPATFVAATGTLLAFLWLYFSPLRGLRHLDKWRMNSGPFPTMASTS